MAVDAWYMNRRPDAEGEFYRKTVTQEPSRKDMNSSTQGRYALGPDGTLYGFNNNRSAERVKSLLQKALSSFQAGEPPALDTSRAAGRYDRTIAPGTVVLDVNAKILDGYDTAHPRWREVLRNQVGEDHLWIRRDEGDALVRGEFPGSLKQRIARFHLNDFTRGEPNPWRPTEVKKVELSLSGGRVAGSAHLETADGARGFTCDLLGFVEGKDGKLARFDLVARGLFWGEGTYTGGAPKGKFPIALSFRLSEGSKEADRVPPQGARDLSDYLR